MPAISKHNIKPKHHAPAALLQARTEELSGRVFATELEALHARAIIIDSYFQETFEKSLIGPGMGVNKNPYAIIALGGYGRQEQCVYSDVDVLFLFEKKIPRQGADLVGEAIYPLWDAGLDVGHATRTVSECVNLGSKDFEVLTSLIDARFICGMSPLYSRLMGKIHKNVLKGKTRSAYLKWLVQGNLGRHECFGDSTSLLEPNLKEGQGGLRDYHAMLWIARVTHGAGEPKDLEYLGLLTHDEYSTLADALDFIWKTRNQLHLCAKRKCDQLYFEYQPKLAAALGFAKNGDLEGIENFLKTLHQAMERVKQRHLMFLLSAMPGQRPGRPLKATRPTSTPGIVIEKGSLVFASPGDIAKDPGLLMDIFVQSAKTDIPLSLAAHRLVREFFYLVDDSFRSSPRVIKAFERVLATSPPAGNALEEMFATRFITAFIPELSGIVDRIQYTHYHVHPVDKHSLLAVRILKGFAASDMAEDDDLYARLYKEIPNKKLLLWAMFLHDVGKGIPKPGHAARGARIVRKIMTRMGYKPDQVEIIEFLVREHLFLIKTATRRDLYDEGTSIACARKMGDPDRLKMLYLLTVADSMATGPKAWNDWTAALLKSLFLKAYQILERGELASAQATSGAKEKRKRVLGFAFDTREKKQFNELYDVMSPRYVHDIEPDDIAKHIRLYERLAGSDVVIEVQPGTNENLRTITVCAKDRPGLFSKIAGVFSLHNLNIFDAQIYTWRNHVALDVFQVTPPLDSFFEQQIWELVEKNLKKALAGDIDLGVALANKLVSWRKDHGRAAPKKERVVVDNETSGFFTIVEVFAYDRLGLLFTITNALYKCGLDIWVAKISTKADQVVDVFYIRDFDGQKVDQPDNVDAIKTTILETLKIKEKL